MSEIVRKFQRVEKKVINSIKRNLRWQKIKPIAIPTLIVFAIYMVLMLSILRAGVSFVDDNGRAVDGYAWTRDFGRVTATLVSYVFQASKVLMDISPLSQIVALLIVSLASVLLIRVFLQKKDIGWKGILSATFVGSTPFILHCWLYKFDALTMAVGVLFAVLPLLFWDKITSKNGSKDNLKTFAIVTTLLTLCWTSYQSATGVFLVGILGLMLRDFTKLVKGKVILQKMIFYILAFVVSFGFLMLVVQIFSLSSSIGYRDVEVFALDGLLSGALHNSVQYALAIGCGFNGTQTVLVTIMSGLFLLVLFLNSRRRGWQKIFDSLAGAVFVILAIPASYSIFMFLQEVFLNGRVAMSVGAIFAIVTAVILHGNFKSKTLRCVTYLPSIILLQSFIIFGLALGNGLLDQFNYGKFRTEVLNQDLSEIYVSRQPRTIQFQGKAGESAVMASVIKKYPVAKLIVNQQQHGLAELAWGNYQLVRYYGRAWNLDGVWVKRWNCTGKHWQIKKDTFYHTIREDDRGRVCVKIKQR